MDIQKAEESGLWACQDDAIAFENLLSIINNTCREHKKKIKLLQIEADCPGAKGIYNRAYIKSKSSNCSNISEIKFYVPCDHDEVAFSGPVGGIWSIEFVEATMN